MSMAELKLATARLESFMSCQEIGPFDPIFSEFKIIKVQYSINLLLQVIE
jgi:hypothetical protein